MLDNRTKFQLRRFMIPHRFKRGFFTAVLACLSFIVIDGQGLMERGIAIPRETQTSLVESLQPLEEAVLLIKQQDDPFVAAYEPDVSIYLKAVQTAVFHNEFHYEKQFEVADRLIQTGLARAAHLLNGKAPWADQTGLVVRGYRSKLDDSIQPYGLVVPEKYQSTGTDAHRMDIWLHGRDNRLTELKFIDQRERSKGQFAPQNAFVLHPYGRFCNAFKFGGEVDVLEAKEHVQRQYSIDTRRVAMRGFSMGGAGCWHLAVHHSDQWVVAAPGAGFSESADYLGLWKKDKKPNWFETKLWRLYDADEYALNLFHLPTVAYSGGADKQIQAARMMEIALQDEGMELAHIIGPDTGHRYHPDSKKEIENRVDLVANAGKRKVPAKVRMTTYTLKYPDMHWVHLEGLNQHWEKAVVNAEIKDSQTVVIETKNVTALSLVMDAGECPLDAGHTPGILIDGQSLEGANVLSDKSWNVTLHKEGDIWRTGKQGNAGVNLKKRPGLQGPIDDAFMDRFVIVTPSGRMRRSKSDRWIRREQFRLQKEWREQFRGEPLSISDGDFNISDWKDAHWVLFGNPETNLLIKQILPYLPIQWRGNEIIFGEHRFDDQRFVPVMVFPNPMNPGKYIVLNSGFTFRGYGSNATQVPRLPDYAVIDTNVRPNTEVPGGIPLAGFFNEEWQLGY